MKRLRSTGLSGLSGTYASIPSKIANIAVFMVGDFSNRMGTMSPALRCFSIKTEGYLLGPILPAAGKENSLDVANARRCRLEVSQS